MKNRIYEYRNKRGMTRTVLEEYAGVSRQTIISIENGKYTASLPLAFKLSKIFGIKIEGLFIFDEI